MHYRGGYSFAGLVGLARELRRRGTPAEALFWELVRHRRFLGLRFRRQHQIGLYIADFYCHEKRLVVEFDGEIHLRSRRQDHTRDLSLQAQGFAVLRFENRNLLDDPEAVLDRIATAVGLCVQDRDGAAGADDMGSRPSPRDGS